MVDVGALIDTDRGLVSRRIFHDEEIYALEQERIFGRCWLFLGHEGQLPNPGDYITCRMGETPVIVAREASGKINALVNSCPPFQFRLRPPNRT